MLSYSAAKRKMINIFDKDQTCIFVFTFFFSDSFSCIQEWEPNTLVNSIPLSNLDEIQLDPSWNALQDHMSLISSRR